MVGVVAGALGLGFVAGRVSAPSGTMGGALAARAQLAQFSPNDPRELVPLVPGPGQDGQQGPGQQNAPNGQQGEQGDCPVLLLKDGQLYEMRPGQPQPDRGRAR